MRHIVPKLKPTVLLVASLFSLSAYAAADLHGVVLKNQLGGEKLPQVAITVSGLANPTTSDSSGKFSLRFPKLEPGDWVELTVEKTGLVVVNEFQLGAFLSKDPNRVSHILMSYPEERETWAIRFYKLKGQENVEVQYRRRIAELQQKGKATAEALIQVENDRNKALALVEDFSRTLAVLRVEQASELYRKAMQLYLDGHLEEAIKILDPVLLDKQTVEARKKLEQAANGWLLRGQFLAQKYQVLEGVSHKIRTPNQQVLPEYVTLDQRLNPFREIGSEYDKALVLYRDLSRPNLDIKEAGDLLQVFQNDEQRLAEAHQAFHHALRIYRDLAKAKPQIYLPEVGNTLSNLGSLLGTQNKMIEAQKAYNEALDLYRELSKTTPQTYQINVARTLNNLGALHGQQQQFAEARAALTASLAEYYQFLQHDTGRFIRETETVEQNLARLPK